MHRNQPAALLLTVALALSACGEGGTDGSAGGGLLTGTGGSTARMTISGDYLYAIAGSNVQLFDISAPQSPAPFTQVQVDWDIETLFSYGDYLLVGAANGVHILDNTDPASPQYVGDFTHARALDPVVAQDGLAYATLKRDSSRPGPGIANQMNIIDISDVTQPELLDTISMQGPSGLSVQGNNLYVCDGIAGLKTFDLSVPERPTVANVVPGLDCFDVIAQQERLYVIDEFGFSQYGVETGTPVLLSTIETEPVIYLVDR